MRHVELTELTKLVQDEEEISSYRETQYTFAKFKDDLESWCRIDKWNQQQWMLTLNVCALLFASTGERLLFKIAVDDMSPFRAVLITIILGISLIIFGCIVLVKGLLWKDLPLSNIFPHKKLFVMAVFDTVSFGGLVISAMGVAPTMTVILMHANTPLMVLGSRYLFPERKYSSLQLTGVAIISCALLIGASRSFLDVFGLFTRPDDEASPHSQERQYTSGVSTIVYICAAGMQGLAALYKEKAIIEYCQPADVHVMSCWLFFYQTLFALMAFPLFYVFQGVTSNWTGYPISSFSDNFWDGFYCILGQDPDPSTALYDTTHTSCSHVVWLVLGYVLSTALVLQCVDNVLLSSGRALGRSMAAAVLVSFVAAILYSLSASSMIENASFGWADFVAIALLLLGMEVFGRDPEPDPELVTNFSAARA